MDLAYLALATISLRQQKRWTEETENPLSTREMAMLNSKKESAFKKALRSGAALASGLKNKLARQHDREEIPGGITTGRPVGATHSGEHPQVSLS